MNILLRFLHSQPFYSGSILALGCGELKIRVYVNYVKLNVNICVAAATRIMKFLTYMQRNVNGDSFNKISQSVEDSKWREGENWLNLLHIINCLEKINVMDMMSDLTFCIDTAFKMLS